MFKKTFLRLLILGSLAFTLFFVLVSAQKAREANGQDCTEAEIKAGKAHPSGEFILETIVGSILVGIK